MGSTDVRQSAKATHGLIASAAWAADGRECIGITGIVIITAADAQPC
jgi:hypothetical protein